MAPPESSWRRLGTSKTSSGELLETSWRLTEPSWRLLESLGGVLGRSWRRLRGILEAPWVVLGLSCELWKPYWCHLEAKRPPKWSPKGSPNELRRRLELKMLKP